MRTVVRARIDEKAKEEAAAVLDAIGLTVSDAFRLMMVRIAAEKRLPFEPLVPNAETVAAMEAARRGRTGHGRRCRRPDRRPQCGRVGGPQPSNEIAATRGRAVLSGLPGSELARVVADLAEDRLPAPGHRDHRVGNGVTTGTAIRPDLVPIFCNADRLDLVCLGSYSEPGP